MASADLTRWNRAGLTRFRYVDGNAVRFLEDLRVALRQAFTREDGTLQWPELEEAIPVLPNETPAERQARWLRQYRDERRDYLWEITRAHARALHILGEYIDVYANEGYLGTASQWDNVRKLVAMLDYQPAPPASAATTLALLAKPERAGKVVAGLACANQPPPGSPTVIFETQEDLDVDAALNILRGRDWNRSVEPMPLMAGTGGKQTVAFPLAAPVTDVAAGSRGVLLQESSSGGDGAAQGWAVTVVAITPANVVLELAAGGPADLRRWHARLLLKPRRRQVPQLTGSNIVRMTGAHSLAVDDVVAWSSGGTWLAARVTTVDGSSVRLSGGSFPGVGQNLYRAQKAGLQTLTVNGVSRSWVLLPLSDQRHIATVWNNQLNALSAGSVRTHPDSGANIFDYVDTSGVNRVYYLPKLAAVVATVAEAAPQNLILPGDPGPLGAGQWLLAEAGGAWQAVRVTGLDVGGENYTLTVSATLSGVTAIHHDFAHDLRPLEHDRNMLELAVIGSEPAGATRIEPEGELHALLKRGRRLVVAGPVQAQAVTVREVRRGEGALIVEPALKAAAAGQPPVYPRADTVIYANAALASHGETQPEAVLGSGDATRVNQTFDLQATAASFIADPSFPSGVRADLQVTVDGRTWHQVPNLADSEPEAADYQVKLLEDGSLRFLFGDGRNARRLPTGVNNVRVVHRSGHGLAGNLAQYSLSKLVRPVAIIDKAVQRLQAAGGNGLEPVSSLRKNAPPSLLTLDRAVSLADFTHLAAAQSSVWAARAFRRESGFGLSEWIEVVVVPAGGGELGELGNRLKATLEAHTLPGVRVTIVGYQPVLLEVRATIQVISAEYVPETVAEATRDALIRAFSLQARPLGGALYLSQLVQVAEAVEGVENCRIEMNPWGFFDDQGVAVAPASVIGGDATGPARRVSLTNYQVFYLDPAKSRLEIVVEEFVL